MAKKCIPGIICVENMTLFILVILSISVGYLYWKHFSGDKRERRVDNSPVVHNRTIVVQTPFPDQSQLPVAGLPVNIRTSTANAPYNQIGILTNNVRNRNGADPLILPLFGRNLSNGRDKWQYYTVANSGGVAFNAKLPISVNGRSCTSEYGCDSVSNGDTVYVEGYDDTFRATIYENATLNYIPF